MPLPRTCMQARASHLRTQSALEGAAAHAAPFQAHQQDVPSLPKVATHTRSASAGPVNGTLAAAAGGAAGGIAEAAAGGPGGPQQQQQQKQQEAALPEQVRGTYVFQSQTCFTSQQLLHAV